VQVTRFWTLLAIFSIAVFASSMAHAVTVGWEGETWDDTYNPSQTTLNVNGLNQLEVTANSAGQFAAAHINTSAAYRAAATPWIEFSFLDTGNAPVRKGIWVEDETTSPLGGAGGWLQFEIPTSGNYRVYYNDYDADLTDNASIDFSTGTVVNTGVARSVGERTFKIGRRANGMIDFWIDGSLTTSLSAAQFSPNFFGDVYLAASGETATYTSFATGTDYAVPEPASVVVAAMAGVGVLLVRRRMA
jgi:hypothetical protein